MGRTPEPVAHVTTVEGGQPLPDNPWEKWGWAFAAIWLVFLAFPVIAVAESDVGWEGQLAALLCIVGFAVANVLGYSTVEAGMSILPAAILMVLIAPRSAIHGALCPSPNGLCARAMAA